VVLVLSELHFIASMGQASDEGFGSGGLGGTRMITRSPNRSKSASRLHTSPKGQFGPAKHRSVCIWPSLSISLHDRAQFDAESRASRHQFRTLGRPYTVMASLSPLLHGSRNLDESWVSGSTPRLECQGCTCLQMGNDVMIQGKDHRGL